MPIHLRSRATVPDRDPAVHMLKSLGLRVTVLHPGYPEPPLSLFSLACLDQTEEDGIGIDSHVVHCAASIVSGNRRGCLLRTLHRSQPELEQAITSKQAENPETEGLLLPGQYYFYPIGWTVTDDPYPITLTFSDWRFPHGEVPEPWNGFRGSDLSFIDDIVPSSVRLFVTSRDRSCRITGWENSCEIAHLVPKCTENWVSYSALHVS